MKLLASGRISCIIIFATLLTISLLSPAEARKKVVDTPLSIEQQAAVKKGGRYARSGNIAKANGAYQPAIDSATDVKQCLAIVDSTANFGHLLNGVRRNALNRALVLVQSPDDLLAIATSARGNQLYEVTKVAVDTLIAKAESKEDLFALARKCSELTLIDVAHLAMEKAYKDTKTTADALAYAKQAKIMSMDDLMRKCVKDLIDDESNAHELCNLLREIEPLQVPDLERQLLKKAVYQVTSVADCKEVFDAAQRLGQRDIINLAAYRGRKMLLMQQIQKEQEALQGQEQQTQQALQGQEQKAANDLAKQNNNYENGPGF